MENIYTKGSEDSGQSPVFSNEGEATMQQKVREVTDKVNQQAVALKERINEQAGQVGNRLAQRIDQVRGRTSTRLRNTSQKLHNLAIYVEEHDARDISQAVLRSSREMIRKHPGRSIVIGLVAGLLLGRLLRVFRR
jgi:ElaB/YqjD/DUF883 family membrane-anchored ribosome-binding protein